MTEPSSEAQALAKAVSEMEQTRLAHQLHDGLSQDLGALAFLTHRIQRALQASEPDLAKLRDTVAQFKGLVDAAVREVQTLAAGPALLEEQGLMAMLGERLGEFAAKHQVECRLEGPQGFPEGHPDIALQLYGLVQEAARHAIRQHQATKIKVSLCFQDNEGTLSISDNGKYPHDTRGEPPNQHALEIRTRLMAGKFRANSRSPQGALIRISFLLPAGS